MDMNGEQDESKRRARVHATHVQHASTRGNQEADRLRCMDAIRRDMRTNRMEEKDSYDRGKCR